MKCFNDYKMKMVSVGFVAVFVVCGGSVKADFTFGEPTKVKGPINHPSYADHPCSMSADGLELYIWSTRPGGYGNYDAWVAKRETIHDSWGEPVNLGPVINSTHNEGARISPDGLTLYIDSDRPGGYGGYDIWVATRESKYHAWGTPVNLGPIVNTSTHEEFPSISSNGLELYYASGWIPAQSNGHIYQDLWMVSRSSRDDPWGNRINLGPLVNSTNQDGRPILSSDGLVLFFDSQRDGRPPYGEIYMARRASLTEPWGLAINLGPIINTPDFEECALISPDASMLYFDVIIVSTHSISSADIWQAPLIPIVDCNGDGIVDLRDFAKLAKYWGHNEPSVDIGPMPWGDGIVDVQDLAVLADYWFNDPTEPKPLLIAHWKLDETAGGIACDSIGGNDAYGPPDLLWRPEDGKVGGALELDGIDDLLFTTFSLNPADTSFSVFAWVKGGAPGQVVISQSGGANWLMADASEGKLMTELQGTGRFDGPLYSQTVITDGAWHRLGITWDGSNRILYVDDVEVARDTQTGLAGSTGGFYFGAGKIPVPPSLWLGLLDDIRIYDRAIVP